MSRIKIGENDMIEILFGNGDKSVSAMISKSKLKELILDEAYEIISEPECESSSCAVNNFCECDPINEDMEYCDIFLSKKETNE